MVQSAKAVATNMTHPGFIQQWRQNNVHVSPQSFLPNGRVLLASTCLWSVSYSLILLLLDISRSKNWTIITKD